MLAVAFKNFEVNEKVIDALIERRVFTDWFLFASNYLRIVPPLAINEAEIKRACHKIIEVLDDL